MSILAFVSWYNVQTWIENRALLADLRESQANLRQRFDGLERRDGGGAGHRQVRPSGAGRQGGEGQRGHPLEVVLLDAAVQSAGGGPALGRADELDPSRLSNGQAGACATRSRIPIWFRSPWKGTAKTLEGPAGKFERQLIFDPHFDRIEPESYANDETHRRDGFPHAFPVRSAGRRSSRKSRSPSPRISRPRAEDAQVARAEPVGGRGGAGRRRMPAEPVVESGGAGSDKLQRIDRGGPRQSVRRMRAAAPEGQPPWPRNYARRWSRSRRADRRTRRGDADESEDRR